MEKGRVEFVQGEGIDVIWDCEGNRDRRRLWDETSAEAFRVG